MGRRLGPRTGSAKELVVQVKSILEVWTDQNVYERNEICNVCRLKSSIDQMLSFGSGS